MGLVLIFMRNEPSWKQINDVLFIQYLTFESNCVAGADRSQGDIEESGAKDCGALANHVSVIHRLTICDASSELTHSVDRGASNTGCDNNKLLWVWEVSVDGEALEESAHIAVSVDAVGSLDQTILCNRELGGVRGNPDLVGG